MKKSTYDEAKKIVDEQEQRESAAKEIKAFLLDHKGHHELKRCSFNVDGKNDTWRDIPLYILREILKEYLESTPAKVAELAKKLEALPT